MKLTIIEAGAPPAPLAGHFPSYPDMFQVMFARHEAGFGHEVVKILDGAPLPAPEGLDAVLITGSPAGAYEDHLWLPPLRQFIRAAHDARTRMVGVCFGHQIIADALGGVVRKSEKGWGLGRHDYEVVPFPPYFDPGRPSLAIACSHQDQVITPPLGARVVLRSDFTPNAGLVYETGRILTVQPHPEFDDAYARELVQLRRGRAPDAVIEAGLASMAQPSDGPVLARAITRFLTA